MTEDEVQEIIGGPPGDYTGGKADYVDKGGPWKYWIGDKEISGVYKGWVGNRGVLWVSFQDGRVDGTDFERVYFFDETFFDKIVSWLRR